MEDQTLSILRELEGRLAEEEQNLQRATVRVVSLRKAVDGLRGWAELEGARLEATGTENHSEPVAEEAPGSPSISVEAIRYPFLKDSILSVLSEADRPWSAAELYTELHRRGLINPLLKQSQKAVQTAAFRLEQDKAIRRVGRGQYASRTPSGSEVTAAT